jgi:hypothetical protein
MFGLFKKDEIKEMIENAKKDAEVPEPIDDQSLHDNVRVGVTNDGRTTLTLTNHNNYMSSMTVTMEKGYVKQLVRLLEATLVEEK